MSPQELLTPEQIAERHLQSARECWERVGLITPYVKQVEIRAQDGTLLATSIETSPDPRFIIGDVCQAMNSHVVGYLGLFGGWTGEKAMERTVQDFSRYVERASDGSGKLRVKADGKQIAERPVTRDEVSSYVFPFSYVG